MPHPFAFDFLESLADGLFMVSDTLQGRLGECLLLAYRTPAESVQNLLPEGLELMTSGEWAFWNIVACRIERMRPLGVPPIVGVTYHHIAYRLYVRARTETGIKQGLFFLRSDVDHSLLSRMGNLITDFRFHRATVDFRTDDAVSTLEVRDSEDGKGEARLVAELAEPPDSFPSSCFRSREEADRFLRYSPLGLSRRGRYLKIAEVIRNEDDWHEMPVKVTEGRWTYLESLGQRDIVLERATRISPMDYQWRLGRRERFVPAI